MRRIITGRRIRQTQRQRQTRTKIRIRRTLMITIITILRTVIIR